MLELKTKKELTANAIDMAHNLSFVTYKNRIYAPMDVVKQEVTDVPPDPDRTVWKLMPLESIVKLANDMQNTMFYNEAEKVSFFGMVHQAAVAPDTVSSSVLLRDGSELKQLTPKGELRPPTGEFCPYFIRVPLNNDVDAKAELFACMVDWFASEEDAVSMLHHLATALNPHWSITRYVVLIGGGANGKSVLLQMVTDLFSPGMVSHVTRQEMSEMKSTCLALNESLINVIFDGPATYLKDSGAEKSFIAGEEVAIRRLYHSQSEQVSTQGLFLEGLNKEPKTSDKSEALQRRLVRFHLPNKYNVDPRFKAYMLTPKMLGALLALMVDHFVTIDEAQVKLAPTAKSIELKHEQLVINNAATAFVEWFDQQSSTGADALIGKELDDVVRDFQIWRELESKDKWDDGTARALLMEQLDTQRKSKRLPGKSGPIKIRVITGFRSQLQEFIDHLHEEAEDDDTTMVEEGAVHSDDSPTTDGSDRVVGS